MRLIEAPDLTVRLCALAERAREEALRFAEGNDRRQEAFDEGDYGAMQDAEDEGAGHNEFMANIAAEMAALVLGIDNIYEKGDNA